MKVVADDKKEQKTPPPKIEYIADLEERYNTWCKAIRNVDVEKYL